MCVQELRVSLTLSYHSGTTDISEPTVDPPKLSAHCTAHREHISFPYLLLTSRTYPLFRRLAFSIIFSDIQSRSDGYKTIVEGSK